MSDFGVGLIVGTIAGLVLARVLESLLRAAVAGLVVGAVLLATQGAGKSEVLAPLLPLLDRATPPVLAVLRDILARVQELSPIRW